MEPKRRVYGVRSGDKESVKFCCDFETEERFNDRFDVFHVDIKVGQLEQTVDPFLAKLAAESETRDWSLFCFRVPTREVDTEMIFSERQRLAVLDEFDVGPRSTHGAESDELRALCEGKMVEKARTVEGAVAKFLNRKLGSARR